MKKTRTIAILILIVALSGCSLFSPAVSVAVAPVYDGPHDVVPLGLQVAANAHSGWHTWSVAWGDGAGDSWDDDRWNSPVCEDANSWICIPHLYDEGGDYRVSVYVDGERATRFTVAVAEDLIELRSSDD